jgi:hypothetical protein
MSASYQASGGGSAPFQSAGLMMKVGQEAAKPHRLVTASINMAKRRFIEAAQKIGAAYMAP